MQRDALTPAEVAALEGRSTLQDLVLASIHVVCHGPYASAQQVAKLMAPVREPVCHNGVMLRAEAVLTATARAVFEALRPEDLDRISQAAAQALEKWPPRFRELDGGSHWRRE